ncbi:MAG TPA: carboxypeptidase-like regulatory domain-containing protein [Clostridia bacterium]|nr:carboxypeptidase-like regulatory domain-containing protein [Clostridia bacterium]
MTRKLGMLAVVLTLTLSASAGVDPGTISGHVRNSRGVPQMGAAVQFLTAVASQPQTVYTDARGFFTAAGLLPGSYSVKVTAPSFLPSLREHISVQPGASVLVNVTLNTLFEAINLVPRRADSGRDEEDWKWTLRSMSNRPILRLNGDGPLVVVSHSNDAKDGVLKAQVAFMAGSDGEGFGGGSDVSTSFNVEQSLFSAGTLSLNGNVGYGSTSPATAVRATYSHTMPDGSKPEMSLTARRFATPELAAHHAALQALALSMSDTTTIGESLELNYGGEMQTVQFRGRATAFRPFGSADLHLGRNTVLEYRYSSSIPNTRHAKGFDTAPADLTESGPRVSMVAFSPKIERARHHEISVSQRRGNNNFQAAYFRDRLRNAALVGVGEDGVESGDILPDVYSGTFTYNGGDLETQGLRLVYQRRLTGDLYATVDYAFGGVLTATPGDWDAVRSSLRNVRRHAVATKVAGTLPGSKTRWIASYRWMSGDDALTPVDMFNVSAGQSDPFLNIFVRQPLPSRRFIPAGMEALIDVRNLLAQGYMPVVGSDGSTVYLVQSARSIRGGLAFIF